MTKLITKTTTTSIKPSLKEKKRYIAIKSNKNNIDEILLKIREFFGIEELGKSGFMYLKEFNYKNNNYYFIIKINPKYISKINRAVIFSKFDSFVNIDKIFGSVKKLKEFLRNNEIKKENGSDILIADNLNDINLLKKESAKIIEFYSLKKIIIAIKPKTLFDNFESLKQIDSKILYLESLNEFDYLLKLKNKYNLQIPYFLKLSTYEGIDIIKTYKSLPIKPIAVFGLENNSKSDFLRFRNSNLNQVVCNFFKDNNIFYGLDLSIVSNEKKKRPSFIGRIYQNLLLIKKYNIPILICSLSSLEQNNSKSSNNINLGLSDFKITKQMFDLN